MQEDLGIAYANPCFSRVNIPPGTTAGQVDQYEARACQSPQGHEGPRHLICGYCEANIKAQQWWKVAKTHVTGLPPMAPQPRYNLRPRRANQGLTPISALPRYFLTTMCRDCEEREIILYLQLRFLGAYPHPPPGGAAMYRWPWNTCTCRRLLEGNLFCYDHRRGGWNHNRGRLNQQRKDNAAWLEGIELRPATGSTHVATAATRQRRRENGVWRACRCGQDPITNSAQAEVLPTILSVRVYHHLEKQPHSRPFSSGIPPTRT